MVEVTEEEAARKTRSLVFDIPLGYYDMVLEQATSIQSIFDMMSTSLQLTSENQHILNSHKIKYEDVQDDNAEKMYLRLRAHYALAAPKAVSKFDGTDVTNNVNKLGLSWAKLASN